MTAINMAYNLNFSFHLGDNVCGLMVVARINFAGTGPPSESLCSRRPPSLRLKLNRKLWCLRNLSPPWWGESKLLSNPTSLNVRGVNGGGNGDTGAPVGCIPSIQYGSLKPMRANTNTQTCIEKDKMKVKMWNELWHTRKRQWNFFSALYLVSRQSTSRSKKKMLNKLVGIRQL